MNVAVVIARNEIEMKMKYEDVDVYCLPDGAVCKMDEKRRSPLEIEECPIGYDECDGK